MPTAATRGRSQLIAGDNRFGLASNADALCVGTRTDAASEASGKLVATAENGQPQNRPQPRNNALGPTRPKPVTEHYQNPALSRSGRLNGPISRPNR